MTLRAPDELIWQPNELFIAEAQKFAEYRLTDQYRADEVEYKAGLGAVLRLITSPDSLASGGAARLAEFAAGRLDVSGLALEPQESEYLQRWPYFQSLLNLLGGGASAVIQASAFRQWAESHPASLLPEMEELLRGSSAMGERFDRFLSAAQVAYSEMFTEGQLRTKEVPRISPQLPAILLCLTDPDSLGLFRPAMYQLSAEAFGYSLDLAGSAGTRYEAVTRMLAVFRDALRTLGCPVADLLEVHNLLWIRAKIPGWSGLGVDRWDIADFEAMRTDVPQDRAKLSIIEAKLNKIGDAFRKELRSRTGREFRKSIFGYYPPSRQSWSYLDVAFSEPRFGSQPTKCPQITVEMRAEGIDIFYYLDLRATTSSVERVRSRVRESRGDPALLGPATAAGYREVQETESGQYMVRRRIPREQAADWPGLGVDELTAELDLLLPIYEAMAADPVPTVPAPRTTIAAVDPMFEDLADALEGRGQTILYGPPGTGKTWTAYRFALWWLTKRWEEDIGDVLSDSEAALAADRRYTRSQRERRVWWIVANPAQWSWDQLFRDGTVDYRYGRLKRNYEQLQPGDLVIGYQANPDKKVVALARLTQTLHQTDAGPHISLEPVQRVVNGLTYEEMLSDPVLSASEPSRFKNQGTLFRLTGVEADLVLARLAERDASLLDLEAEDPSEGVGPLTRVTFHPSYTYEDFVEGYRPAPTLTGQLNLELKPGVFKRVCRAAGNDPQGRPFLLLIDEINRGNIAKIFGELITLIELDKRGQGTVLPQSGDPFAVPHNVFVLGTMNTADRSIRMLDAALRRRFAFIELLPNASLLDGAKVGELDLARFLEELNLRIIKRHGREKQVGHSLLMEDGRPVASTRLFAGRFRREILPLLQEYAYDDFRELAVYLGPDLVDEERQRTRIADMSSDELVAALAAEYGTAPSDPEVLD